MSKKAVAVDRENQIATNARLIRINAATCSYKKENQEEHEACTYQAQKNEAITCETPFQDTKGKSARQRCAPANQHHLPSTGASRR
mmetsp:Transcript_32353/g.51797  ORF Transcript_32353/g.51797 Transcript_32353/m.51797 type:complete len:86 (-) Transcript_32353:102-359(-)